MPHIFRSIFHPTSFSGAQDAFAHALRIAVAAHGDLSLVHVNARGSAPAFDPFPRVRSVLSGWGLIAPDAAEGELSDRLGVTVAKKLLWDDNPGAAIAEAIAGARPDLLVLSLADRTGIPDLLQPSIAESVLRATRRVALCVRRGGGGFVSPDDGSVRLKSILVPVAESLPCVEAVDTALSLCELLGVPQPAVHVLRVGARPPDDLDLPFAARATLRVHAVQGPVVETILDMQRRLSADLLCMPIARRRGVVSAMIGGVADRVLRSAPCPVLLAPR